MTCSAPSCLFFFFFFFFFFSLSLSLLFHIYFVGNQVLANLPFRRKGLGEAVIDCMGAIASVLHPACVSYRIVGSVALAVFSASVWSLVCSVFGLAFSFNDLRSCGALRC